MAEAKKLREITRFKTNYPEWLIIVNDNIVSLPNLNTFQQLEPLYSELFEGNCPPVTAATRNVIKNKILQRLVEIRGSIQPVNDNRMNTGNNANIIGRSAKSKRSKSKRSKSKRSKSKRSKSKKKKGKKRKY